jgi:hypothetical protein
MSGDGDALLSAVGTAGGGDGGGNMVISVWSWILNFVIFISVSLLIGFFVLPGFVFSNFSHYFKSFSLIQLFP